MQDSAGPMMPNDDNDPIAEALRKLSPQPPGFSRDALLFAAGKAAGEPRVPVWFWPTTTAVFASATVVLACFLMFPSEPTVRFVNVPQTVYVERTVEIPIPVPENYGSQGSQEVSTDDSSVSAEVTRKNWRMRMEALRWGEEMIPRPYTPASPGRQSTPADPKVLTAPPTMLGLPGMRLNKPKNSLLSDDEDN